VRGLTDQSATNRFIPILLVCGSLPRGLPLKLYKHSITSDINIDIGIDTKLPILRR
jgi:hypothetical protein